MGKRKAFTLAELLIALAILGVIATFTIPKILTDSEAQKNKTIFKEAIASVNAALYEGVISGTMDVNMAGSYILNNLSSVKRCTNSRAEGCAAASQTGFGYDFDQPGVILHSGALLYGFDDILGGQNSIMIDANGITPPNTVGEDMLEISFCVNKTGCPLGYSFFDSAVPFGKVSYMWDLFDDLSYRDANQRLFQNLFK